MHGRQVSKLVTASPSPTEGAENCDEQVCLSVCVYARLVSTSDKYRTKFTYKLHGDVLID